MAKTYPFSAAKHAHDAPCTESYAAMKLRHQQEVNDFPLGAAFSKEQFDEMMKNFGLCASDNKAIVSLGYGTFIQKKDIPAWMEMTARHREEMEKAIAADQTGDGFIYQMFYSELADHEYGYTMDAEDALNALGITIEEIDKDPLLARGFLKAADELLHGEEE